MGIEYDPDKSQTNIVNRGLSFDLVAQFDFESALTRIDDRKEYPEVRYQSLGYIGERLHVVVYAIVSTGIRVISLRKANTREVDRYEQET